MTILSSTLVPLNGGSYYGLVVPMAAITSHLKTLSEVISIDEFMEAIKSKDGRDGSGNYHITVTSPKETRSLKKAGLKVPTGKEFQYKITGIGSANDRNNTAYYVLVDSGGIQSVRSSLGLELADLHVTLGFIGKDVHGVPKDESTKIA